MLTRKRAAAAAALEAEAEANPLARLPLVMLAMVLSFVSLPERLRCGTAAKLFRLALQLPHGWEGARLATHSTTAMSSLRLKWPMALPRLSALHVNWLELRDLEQFSVLSGLTSVYMEHLVDTVHHAVPTPASAWQTLSAWPLKKLEMVSCRALNLVGLQHVAACSSLRSLYIGMCGVTDADLRPLQSLASLEHLELASCPLTGAFAAFLPTNLCSLSIRLAQWLVELPLSLARLQSLSLYACPMLDNAGLLRLQPSSTVETLTMGRMPLLTDDALLVLTRFLHLRTLTLNTLDFTGEGWSYFMLCPRLTVLRCESLICLQPHFVHRYLPLCVSLREVTFVSCTDCDRTHLRELLPRAVVVHKRSLV